MIQVTIMLENIKTAYADHHGLRRVSYSGLLLIAALLYWLSGGFPPAVWRFFIQTIPQFLPLWHQHGTSILLPLLGLVLLSLTLLVLWIVLVTSMLKAIQYEWFLFRQHQGFQQDLAEAEQLAQQMLEEETEQTEQPYMEQPYTGRPRVIATTMMDDEVSQPVIVGAIPRGRPATPTSLPIPTKGRPTRPLTQHQPLVTASQEMVALQEIEPSATKSPITRGGLRLLPRPDEEDRPDENEEEAEIDDIPEIDTPNHKEPVGLEVSVGLHTGFQRKHSPNEDALFEIRGTHTTKAGLQHVGLFVVADGMHASGHGQEASHLAIEAVSSVIVPMLLSDTKVAFADLLKESISAANIAIYRQNKALQEHGEGKMGTTITASLILGPTAYIASVGNSRAYLYRRHEGLKQITRDHTPGGILQEQGSISADDLQQHPHRKMLDRYLGRQASIEVDTFALPLQDGDTLLLCSDGLWAMVRDSESAKILADTSANLAQISTALVQSALNHGGADNISVIVVQYHGDDEDM